MSDSPISRRLLAWMLAVGSVGCDAGAAEQRGTASAPVSLEQAPATQGSTAGAASTLMPPPPASLGLPDAPAEFYTIEELCKVRDDEGFHSGASVVDTDCENKECGETCDQCSICAGTMTSGVFACDRRQLCVEVVPPVD